MFEQSINLITVTAFTVFVVTMYITLPKFTVGSGIHLLFLFFAYYVLLRNIDNIFLISGFCITYMLIYRKTLEKQITDENENNRELDLSKITSK
jgi:small-conductance mechanosensitive channel